MDTTNVGAWIEALAIGCCQVMAAPDLDPKSSDLHDSAAKTGP
jgi:hypothetical protein